MTDSSKWDVIYSQKTDQPSASYVLTENQHLLPTYGKALDLACGQGGNARLLADLGLNVLAWDTSEIAVKQLDEYAISNKVSIDAQLRDVINFPPEANSLDVLVVSFFLDRSLCSKLIEALKPGGLLFYQTYCEVKVDQLGPKNPDFLLGDNELLRLFSAMKIRVYREESLLGDQQQGWRNQAILVAEKPF